MKREDVDAAIDRAVRDLMAVDPRPGLAGRVRARLDAPRRAIITAPRLAAVAAVSVALVLMMLTFRKSPAPRPAETAAVVTTAPRTVGPEPLKPTPRAEPPSAGAPPASVTQAAPAPDVRERRVQAASVDSAETLGDGIEIEPIGRVEPIAIRALADEPIAGGEIQIAPLNFTLIEIAPMTSPR
jgi:hypothetical protein